jgi:DNA-binding response OmpR family regulator
MDQFDSSATMVDVLVVIGDEHFATTLGRLLARSGAEVTLAHSAAEAWLLTGERDYSGAVIDLNLVDGDAVEVAERLLRTARVGSVVFCGTGPVTEAERTRAGQVGEVCTELSPRALMGAVLDTVRTPPYCSGVMRVARGRGERDGTDG